MTNNNTTIETHIEERYRGERLDVALASIFPDYSRSYLQASIKRGDVLVDGKVLRARDTVKGGEAVTLVLREEDSTDALPQAIAIDIVFEDEDLLVVNKDATMVTHPAPGHRDGTLLNAALHHHPALSQLPRGGIIHRLDKGTSGLLLIAKNHSAYTKLTQAMQEHRIQRHYFALVWGNVTTGGNVDAPIGRHPHHRKKMAVIENGRSAVTHYRIAERFRLHTALDLSLETGRTHQIRVHLTHIGYPVVGDTTYGKRRPVCKGWSEEAVAQLANFPRQALHAKQLTLVHPRSATECTWQAPLPDDMEQLLSLMRREEANHG